MRKILILALIAFFLALPAGEAAAEFRIGGDWLTEGEGFGEWDPIRLELHDEGSLTFRSIISGDYELITGYEMRGKLSISGFEVNVWSDYDDHDYPVPIPVPLDLNPSMSDPYVFPVPLTFNDLTYKIEFTSVTSGKIRVQGYVDVDTLGTVEIKGDNVIWKKGTEKPSTPNTSSGCSAGGFGLAAVAALALLAGRRRG